MIQRDSFALRDRPTPSAGDYSFQHESSDLALLADQVAALRTAIQPLLLLKDSVDALLRLLLKQDQLPGLVQSCLSHIQGLRQDFSSRITSLQSEIQEASALSLRACRNAPTSLQSCPRGNKENQQSGNKPPRPRLPSAESGKLLLQNKSSSTIGDFQQSSILVRTGRAEQREKTLQQKKKLVEQDLQRKLKEEAQKRRQFLGSSKVSFGKDYSSTRYDRRTADRSSML